MWNNLKSQKWKMMLKDHELNIAHFVGVKNYQEFCIQFLNASVFSFFLFSDNKEHLNVKFCNYKHILMLLKVFFLCI